MEVAVFSKGEHVLERTRCHFEDGGLDGGELCLDEVGVGAVADKGTEDFTGLVFATLEHEPARGLGKKHDEGEDDAGEEDLEGEREAPRDLAGVGKEKTKVDPVTDCDTAGNHRTFNHDELTTFVGLATFRLPCWDGRRVHAISCNC